jgi:hypothetical protein
LRFIPQRNHVFGADYKLISDVASKIEEKEAAQGTHSLTEAERVIDLVIRAWGLIENGGFQYFYEQELDAESVARAYEAIGCSRCAEIMRLSLSLFPDSVLRAGWDERVAFMQKNEEMFYNTSCLFWDANTETEKRFAEFIRANVCSIPCWRPDDRSPAK